MESVFFLIEITSLRIQLCQRPMVFQYFCICLKKLTCSSCMFMALGVFLILNPNLCSGLCVQVPLGTLHLSSLISSFPGNFLGGFLYLYSIDFSVSFSAQGVPVPWSSSLLSEWNTHSLHAWQWLAWVWIEAEIFWGLVLVYKNCKSISERATCISCLSIVGILRTILFV